MAHVANLTIDYTKVAADQTDFPVYVDLSTLNTAFWTTVANGGGDIRVFKSDGVTELPREVVSCVTGSNTGELHFKYSGTLSASISTVVQIRVDGVSADYSVSATYGRNNVWTGYVAVYHLKEASGNAGDSTASAYTLTNTVGQSYVSSLMGKGVDFGSSIRNTTEFTKVANILPSLGDVTMSLWFKQNLALSAGNPNPGLFILPYMSPTGAAITIIPEWNTGSPRIDIIRRATADVNATNTFANDVTTYHHIAAVFDSSAGKLFGYLDGAAFSTTNVSSSGNFNSASYPISLGGSFMSNNATAIVDEVRISTNVKSATWTTTEYNNQFAPSTFYTVANVTQWSFDAFSESARNDVATSPQTIAHICSGSNRLLVVGIMNKATETITGVTYAGVPMIELATYSPSTDGDGNRHTLWYLPAPATGSNNISVSFSATTSRFTTSSASYTGIQQTPTIHASGEQAGSARATSTKSLSGLTVGDLLIGTIGTSSGSIAGTGGTTIRDTVTSIYTGIGDKRATATTDSVDFTHASDWTQIFAVAFAEASFAAAPTLVSSSVPSVVISQRLTVVGY